MTTTTLPNPWGIHCAECSADDPCPLCAEQIAAEHEHAAEQPPRPRRINTESAATIHAMRRTIAGWEPNSYQWAHDSRSARVAIGNYRRTYRMLRDYGASAIVARAAIWGTMFATETYRPEFTAGTLAGYERR